LVIFAVLICGALSGKVAAAKTADALAERPDRLKNLSSGREVSTVSDDLGQYSFAGILPGDYELSVTLARFATLTRRITLPHDPAPKADLQLNPRDVQQYSGSPYYGVFYYSVGRLSRIDGDFGF